MYDDDELSIQSGAFKWEYLNISVTVDHMKKLQGTKLYNNDIK